MSALLYCRTGPMSGASFSLDAETTIGRAAENTVTLSDDRISSRHARIWPDEASGEWMLQDLDSSNGTMVDGSPTSEPVPLGDLSVVTFAGRFDFIFQVVSSASVAAPSAPVRTAGDDVATQAAGAPPSLPEPGRSGGENESVRTRVGGGAPSLPDVEADADDAVHTRVGGGTPSLPDTGSVGEGLRTKAGGAAPDLPDTGADARDDGVRTRAGGAPPDLPDTSAGAGDEDVRTRAGGAAPDLPDVSGGAETTGPGDAGPGDAETIGPGGSKAPAAGSFTLHVRSSKTNVSEFDLQAGANVVGRSSDADIRIDDASLSRSHAIITVDGRRITVRDDGSKNGTWIDGEKVTGERALTPDNRLRFGFRIEAWVSSD